MNDVDVHVQPGGEVVVSAWLEDGRRYRVIGLRACGGCTVADELYKVLRWMASKASRSQ